MIVLLDCDGVLSDFTGRALLAIEDIVGERFCHDDVTEWSFGNLVPEPEQARRFWSSMAQPGVCQEIDALPHARESVERLRVAGHTVVAVTAPLPKSPTWAYERELWLRDEVGIERSHVVSTSSKGRIRGDVLVDDKPDNLREWRFAGGGLALLVDHPYNRGAEGPWHRVCDVRDAVDVILDRAGARNRSVAS